MGLLRRTPSPADADRHFDEGVAAMRDGDLRRSLSALLKAHRTYAALGSDEAARRGAARTLWRQANVYSAIGVAPNALAAGLDAAMIWEALLQGPGDIGLIREMSAGAFRMAGYRHVIATMWALGDRTAAQVAAAVYPALLRGEGPTEALDAAVLALRDRYPATPSRWAAHIHVGA